jgi:hypothetical protein
MSVSGWQALRHQLLALVYTNPPFLLHLSVSARSYSPASIGFSLPDVAGFSVHLSQSRLFSQAQLR